MTPKVIDLVLNHLSFEITKGKTLSEISDYLKSNESIDVPKIELELVMDFLIAENLVKPHNSGLHSNRGKIVEGTEYIKYSITYPGYHLSLQDGYRRKLELEKVREDIRAGREKLEIRSIDVNTETNRALLKNIPIQKWQNWITAGAALVSLIFIVMTAMDTHNDETDVQLKVMNETLKNQQEDNKLLRQSLQELMKNQTTKTTDTIK